MTRTDEVFGTRNVADAAPYPDLARAQTLTPQVGDAGDGNERLVTLPYPSTWASGAVTCRSHRAPLTSTLRASMSSTSSPPRTWAGRRTPWPKKIHILERGTDMVLAAHHTPIGHGLVATTVETVRFTHPERIDFRLVRGPVPYVLERFHLREADAGTELEYSGELATDLWAAGRWWGTLVARRWEAAVQASLDEVKVEAERRARRYPEAS